MPKIKSLQGDQLANATRHEVFDELLPEVDANATRHEVFALKLPKKALKKRALYRTRKD